MYFTHAICALCFITAINVSPAHAQNSLQLPQLTAPGINTSAGSEWHLVRTPGPDKQGDTVSIMHTADLLNSDPDFAGMMVRCQEKSDPQVAFVVVTPFKPRSKTRITVSVGETNTSFDGSVVGPGSMVALPTEAASLLRQWQKEAAVKVEIAGPDTTIKGRVSLAGLSEALPRLEASCGR